MCLFVSCLDHDGEFGYWIDVTNPCDVMCCSRLWVWKITKVTETGGEFFFWGGSGKNNFATANCKLVNISCVQFISQINDYPIFIVIVTYRISNCKVF